MRTISWQAFSFCWQKQPPWNLDFQIDSPAKEVCKTLPARLLCYFIGFILHLVEDSFFHWFKTWSCIFVCLSLLKSLLDKLCKNIGYHSPPHLPPGRFNLLTFLSFSSVCSPPITHTMQLCVPLNLLLFPRLPVKLLNFIICWSNFIELLCS